MKLKEVPVTVNFERLVESNIPEYSGWLNPTPGAKPVKWWNPLTQKYKRTRKRYGVLEGSSGSSKTISILQYLLSQQLLRRKVKVDCFRFDQATCNDSVIEDFRFVMGPEQLDLWDDKRWNEQRKQYKFKNGSMLRFRGCSKPGKLHGPRRDIAWLNEVTEINYKSFRQINARTHDFVLMDFNPSISVHWVFKRILTQGKDRVDHFHSTFRDNPFISPEARADIMSWEPTAANRKTGTADQWAWEVYGLGRRARREGAIFDNWKVLSDELWPKNVAQFQRHGYGLDFGYSQDPTALVECFLYRDAVYLREVVYSTGLITTVNQTNPDKPSLELSMREAQAIGLFNPELEIVGDNAAGEDIDDLQTSGFNVVACEKGAGSINYGINLLKQFTMYIHQDSVHVQGEAENYAWKQLANGDFSDVPIDDFNHAFDGVRYWAKKNIRPRALITNKGRSRGKVVKRLRRY